MDDFLLRALLGGFAVALVAAPLGVFVVWRRMAYFGDATAHAAMLGVALSLASPSAAKSSMVLGQLFVSALKAVAPILVLLLVASAIANRKASHTAQMRPIVLMYLVLILLNYRYYLCNRYLLVHLILKSN